VFLDLDLCLAQAIVTHVDAPPQRHTATAPGVAGPRNGDAFLGRLAPDDLSHRHQDMDTDDSGYHRAQMTPDDLSHVHQGNTYVDHSVAEHVALYTDLRCFCSPSVLQQLMLHQPSAGLCC
jgi:hypothetical protein